MGFEPWGPPTTGQVDTLMAPMLRVLFQPQAKIFSRRCNV
jgi:hypothetical protein